MNLVNPRTFNPEIIYLFDPWTQSESHGEMHHHDFLEISVLLEGESMYYFEKEPAKKFGLAVSYFSILASITVNCSLRALALISCILV